MKIGIDLGTTNCTISRIDDMSGAARTISPIPSVGYWQNGKMYFGSKARRDLGQGASDIYPLKDIKMLLGDPAGLTIHGNKIPAVEIISNLLKYIYTEEFGMNSPDEVSELVIATPVLSSREHRVDLLSACRAAGFCNKVSLVYEPTAALLGSAYLDVSQGKTDSVVVVDWGGGTLDVSVVHRTESGFRELSVGGDNFSLGGSKIDQEITRKILNEHPEIKDAVAKIEGGFERLTFEIEDAKIEMLEGLYQDDEMISPEWLSRIGLITIPYKTVCDVVEEFSGRALKLILNTVADAGLKSDAVTHVLFAGGVCKSEMVKEQIRKFFPYTQEIPDSNPQALTGLGCAFLARLGFTIRIASNFGVRQCDNMCCILLMQGQNISTDRYRQAEFMVTDTRAAEAIIDLGIQNEKVGFNDLMIESGGFSSRKQIFLTVGGNNNVKSPVADRIIMFVSLSEDLTIRVYVQAKLSNARELFYISGIPLFVDVKGAIL